MPWVCMGPRVRKGAMGEDIPLDIPTPKQQSQQPMVMEEYEEVRDYIYTETQTHNQAISQSCSP